METNKRFCSQIAIPDIHANLLDLSNDAIYAWNFNGRIIYWNKGAELLYGYISKEVVGQKNSYDLLKSIHQNNFDSIISILDKDGHWNGELETITRVGKKITVEARLQVFSDESDQKIVLEINKDITEHKETKQSLGRNKKKINDILSDIKDHFYVLDQDWNFVYANKQLTSGIGKEPEDFIGNNIWAMFPKHIGSVVEENFRASMKKREIRRFNIDGIYTNACYSMAVFPSEEGITVIGMDITEQKKAEEALNISEARFRTALKGSPVVVFSHDTELRYTWVYNPSGGFNAEMVLGKRDDEIYSSDDASALMAIKRNVLASGVGRRDEVITHSPFTAGGALIHDMTTEPMRDMSGAIVGVICAAFDITERKKLEVKKERLQLEKNEALENAMKMKDEFLATISHEFKTPLTVINAAIQTINTLYGNQISDNIRKHLGRIRTNSFRQLRLVNNLLDLTRYNTGHFKIDRKNLDIVFLTNAIVNSVDPYAKQKGVELRFLSEKPYLEMAIDEEKYERILLNLLSNAIKFTPKGKSIFIGLHYNNRKAFIRIKDEGIGIPKCKQKLIFERFGQVDSSLSRQAEGTGIGLSLVKTLVTGLKGTISVESEVGRGSTFTISLPVTKLRRKEPDIITSGSQDSKIMHAAAIEFSDLYFD